MCNNEITRRKYGWKGMIRYDRGHDAEQSKMETDTKDHSEQLPAVDAGSSRTGGDDSVQLCADVRRTDRVQKLPGEQGHMGQRVGWSGALYSIFPVSGLFADSEKHTGNYAVS